MDKVWMLQTGTTISIDLDQLLRRQTGLRPPVCTVLAASLPTPVVDAERVNTVSVLNRDDELAGYLRVIDPKICKLKYLKLPATNTRTCTWMSDLARAKN
jgi:hypothetical protein